MIPEGHPIDFARAKALVEGPLGALYKRIGLECCAPFFWYRPGDSGILHNATMTLAHTGVRLLGITAAHVLHQYRNDSAEGPVRVQLGPVVLEEVPLIDESVGRDLATVALDAALLCEWRGQPLTTWPPQRPTEGRGVILAGFPARTREQVEQRTIDWSPFVAVTTARSVTDDQITVLVSREEHVTNTMPVNADLGGISGGPIIGIFETKHYVAHHVLAGIITEHPHYESNEFGIERIIGASADVITAHGTIR